MHTIPSLNRKSAILLLVMSLLCWIAVPLTASAQGDLQKERQDLEGQIEPTLQINIPTIQFSKIKVVDQDSRDATLREIDIPWIAQYMAGIYDYAIMIASALAAVMMIIGGFQYMTAGGDASRVSDAKKRISDALVGLALTLGTYTILYVVNPDLLKFDALRISFVKRSEFSLPLTFPEDEEAGTDTGSVDLKTVSGENFKKPIQFNSEFAGALENAGKQLAERTKDMDGGPFKIKGSGGRALATQARLYKERCIAGTYSGTGTSMTFKPVSEGRKRCTIPVCNPFKKADFITDPSPDHKGKWLKEDATPYVKFCPHTSGFAVDISCDMSKSSIHGIYVPCHLILEQVMKDNGFCRLSSEPWHFEQPKLSKTACLDTWTPGTHKEKGVTHTYSACEGWYDSYSASDSPAGGATDDTARCKKK